METINNLGALLPINENNGRRAVNARDLHSFLESKQDFSTWMKNRIDQYGFVENQDYQVFHKIMENPKGGRPSDEYALSIDMAKELSMVERTERGKQARRYFIACEKGLVQIVSMNQHQQNKPKQVNASKKRVEAFGAWVTMLSSAMNLDEYSKYMLIKQEGEQLMFPVPEAPVCEAPVDNLTNLLNTHNVMNGNKPMKAHAFHVLLVNKGYMREIPRTKSNGKPDNYYSFTDKGSKFGINRWDKYSSSPKSKDYFFIDKFEELLKELKLK